MENIIDFMIMKYELGLIFNKNDKRPILVTNNLDNCKNVYDMLVNKYKSEDNHIIVYLFDYDKNTNIEYYDNKSEIL